MTRAELLERLRELKPWLAEQGIENLRLFGSFARDEAGPDSDVDLIVGLSRRLGIQFFAIQEELADRIGRPVEMCEESELANPFVRRSALRDAVEV